MNEFRDFFNEQMEDPEIKAEYEALRPEFEIREQIIKARAELNLTQKELADRIGTKQSSISRFEKGDYTPDLTFLQKLASGLGKELHIEFR